MTIVDDILQPGPKKKKTQTNLHALAGWLIDGFSAPPAPRACFSCSIVWTSTIVICWACGYQCPCVGLKPASQACSCQIFFIPYCNLTYQLLLSYLRNTTLGQIPDSQFPIPQAPISAFSAHYQSDHFSATFTF